MMEGRKGDRVAATGLWAGQRAATSHRLACGGKRDKLAGVGGGQGVQATGIYLRLYSSNLML